MKRKFYGSYKVFLTILLLSFTPAIIYFFVNYSNRIPTEQRKLSDLKKIESKSEEYSNIAMFRANLKHTGVYNTKGVYPFGELKWKFKIQKGMVYSSPAVTDGVVYSGSGDEYLYAVDSKTGQEKWKFKTKSGVYSSPAVVDGVVYFGGIDGYLYAVDSKTGQEKWKFKTGGYVRSSPAIDNGVIYFGSDDKYLYAIDIKTGQEKWKFKAKNQIYSSPAIEDGVVYFGRDFDFGSDDGYLYAVDSKTGQEKWKFRTEDGVHSSPAITDGVVYFGSMDGCLYAVDSKTGQEKWKFKTEENQVESSPAIADGVIYFGGVVDGYLYAIDIKTGQEKWKFKTEDCVRSSPVIADGVVYFGSDDGYLYAIQSTETKKSKISKNNIVCDMEINEKSDGYDWDELTDPNKSKVCEIVNDAWGKPYGNIKDLVSNVNKYYRDIGDKDKTLFNVIESYILLKTKHDGRIDNGLYAQIQEKRKKYISKTISQGAEEKKSISDVAQRESEIYNYLQDRWDYYKERDGKYIPELHDDLTLSDTANHFGISKDEVEKIFNKVDQQKIDKGIGSERIDRIEKRTEDVLSGME